jgi:ArsR family transcriptional regulator, arsenate/arsenite/antimonite-responsive transcriptional repressor / arsenate reductase (thioredoxin)
MYYRQMLPSQQSISPPPFLALAGDPLRWQLLHALARSDRRVGELTDQTGQPQNLVSYHLRKLRSAGVVTARRSSHDGRDVYYRLDLIRCRELLAATGRAIHPGLRPAPPAAEIAAPAVPCRVLFLCTGNSARSQIAEALLTQLAPAWVQAFSAGSRPKPLHPNAIGVLAVRGIDISGRGSKHLDQFSGQRFDYVISLCDRVREVCPEFPDHPNLIHWSMPDPSAGSGTDEASYPAFEATADELHQRITFLLHTIADTATEAH